MRFRCHLLAAWIVVGVLALQGSQSALAWQHNHDATTEKVKPPKIFLDKKPRIVKYQLGRLNNARLLLVERADSDPKYLLVHEEILLRDGMALHDRDDAIQAVAKINQSDPVTELLRLIPLVSQQQSKSKKGAVKQTRRVEEQLIGLLLRQDIELLGSKESQLIESVNSDNTALQLAGFASLITTDKMEQVTDLTAGNPARLEILLQAVPLLPGVKQRNALRPQLLAALNESNPVLVRKAALQALAQTTAAPAETFQLVQPLVEVEELRRAAVSVLTKIPAVDRDVETTTKLAKYLVDYAEKTPASERTSDQFLEAMQLTDQLFSLIDADTSDQLRRRLAEVSVRVVLVHTVEEEMRYDIPWFAVEAGRDVQIVLKNEDLMPHNFVITAPDALQEVALLAAAEGPRIGPSGKQYVPQSDKVLVATEMVPAEQQARVTFKAPSSPGEYPYVCTFPGHWMRMYGVMVVVDDLAAFQRNPVEPKDPIGSNRPLVKNWVVDDLQDQVETGLRGRTKSIGEKIFNEATCAQCHVVAGQGQAVGPELTDVWVRWKGDSVGILREIIEPSHKIDPKYIVQKIVTVDGLVISGIVLSETNDSISILPDPQSVEPTVVAQEDIEDMMKSAVSIMPKGLMDRFTEDEIFELMAYLKSVAPPGE